ncbi:YneF family protein [Mycoplasma wenyonii]|uniref:YneF family protein n=1 Tax=Mycoplasma wenyonii TaxID=65123 RepID=A0A328PTM4_9MOLU|nr:YneF family protein [Mycoplasma wenyonii]RAO95070.1 YneF family protein [Mycoplasma wenyonii]
MSFTSLVFADSTNIGWGVGLVCVFIFGILLGHKLTAKWFSRKVSKQNLISASQVREMYRQIGRTPTERQIRQMLAAVNNKQE